MFRKNKTEEKEEEETTEEPDMWEFGDTYPTPLFLHIHTYGWESKVYMNEAGTVEETGRETNPIAVMEIEFPDKDITVTVREEFGLTTMSLFSTEEFYMSNSVEVEVEKCCDGVIADKTFSNVPDEYIHELARDIREFIRSFN